MHERNRELGDEFDALHREALDKGRRVEELAMELDESNQAISGETVKAQYTHARVHAMEGMQRTLDSACGLQDDEAATLGFMRERLDEYLRRQREVCWPVVFGHGSQWPHLPGLTMAASATDHGSRTCRPLVASHSGLPPHCPWCLLSLL